MAFEGVRGEAGRGEDRDAVEPPETEQTQKHEDETHLLKCQ